MEKAGGNDHLHTQFNRILSEYQRCVLVISSAKRLLKKTVQKISVSFSLSTLFVSGGPLEERDAEALLELERLRLHGRLQLLVVPDEHERRRHPGLRGQEAPHELPLQHLAGLLDDDEGGLQVRHELRSQR